MAPPKSDPRRTPPRRRLTNAERRHQLIETALRIVREEGADRLTLGHLAARAGVSKPIAYDHFGTRAGLLIELYKTIDREQTAAVHAALTTGERDFGEIVDALAAAYIHCSVDTGGEWHAVRAALTGNPDVEAVHQELLGAQVTLFTSVFAPHSGLTEAELERRCIGLVGAGEALSAAMIRGQCSEADASTSFASLIKCALEERRAPLHTG